MLQANILPGINMGAPNFGDTHPDPPAQPRSSSPSLTCGLEAAVHHLLKKLDLDLPKHSSKSSDRNPTVKLTSGLEMPQIGVFTCDPSSKSGETQTLVLDALSRGYRHFDCSWISPSEHEVGAALNAQMEAGVIKRDEIFLTSKLWIHRPDLVEVGLRQGLAKLQVEYLDLLLLHNPTANQAAGHPAEGYPVDEQRQVKGAQVGLCDTWAAMETLVQRGLVKSIGVCNFNVEQLQKILSQATIPPAVNQVEVMHDRNMLEFCNGNDIHMMANLWMESTFLEDCPVVREIGEKCDKSPRAILVRWALQQEIAVVLKKDDISGYMDLFDFRLSKEDMEVISNLSLGHVHKNLPQETSV